MCKRSTVTNMLICLNDWTCALTNRQSIAVAYIDFQKAFDSVNHSKLFSKLSYFGILMFIVLSSHLCTRAAF